MKYAIKSYLTEVEIKKQILEELCQAKTSLEEIAKHIQKIGFPLKKNGELKKKVAPLIQNALDSLNQNNTLFFFCNNNHWGKEPPTLFWIALKHRKKPEYSYTICEVNNKGEIKHFLDNLIEKLKEETDNQKVENNIKTFKEIYEKAQELPFTLRSALQR